MPERIATAHQVVEIPTKRGTLTVGPRGRIGGLRRVLPREVRTNAQVRRMCGNITRHTLIRWRASQGFPEPLMTIKETAKPIELWSRTEVEDWLRSRGQKVPAQDRRY